MDDDEFYRRTLEHTRAGVAWLTKEIQGLGCQVFDTHTNFFLVDVGTDGRGFYEKLLRLGVIVRPMNAYGYPGYIRITVGTEAENQRLVKAMAQVLAESGQG